MFGERNRGFFDYFKKCLKKGTGGSLIIFKMFGERNRRVFDYFQNVWRKEPEGL
jgi:hypothetical protein